MGEIPLDDLGLAIERVFEKAKAEIAKEDIANIGSVYVILTFDDGKKCRVVPLGVGRKIHGMVSLSMVLREMLARREWKQFKGLFGMNTEVRKLRRLPDLLCTLEESLRMMSTQAIAIYERGGRDGRVED